MVLLENRKIKASIEVFVLLNKKRQHIVRLVVKTCLTKAVRKIKLMWRGRAII